MLLGLRMTPVKLLYLVVVVGWLPCTWMWLLEEFWLIICGPMSLKTP